VATIVQGILDVISANAYPVGHRLGTKAELKKLFSVAEGTLNESLRVLEGHGMVTFRPGPGGGVFVSEPSPEVRLNRLVLDFKHDPELVTDCLQVRESLEPLVVDEACRFCTKSDLAELTDLLTNMRISSEDPAKYMLANWDLHRRIAVISKNTVLRTTYVTLLDFVQAALSRVRAVNAGASVGVSDWPVHEKLIIAIGQRDHAQAARALRRHQALLHPPHENGTRGASR